jgi:large subunit ribosomal protein L16
MNGPKKTKYRKSQRLRGGNHGIATRGALLAFGAFGLKAIEGGEVSARQIEASRRALTHYIKRGGKVWIRIFPHKPITMKAAEVPMGSGKGTIDRYVSVVKAGTIIFEMDGIDMLSAKEALRLASHKLPLKCKFINSSTLI